MLLSRFRTLEEYGTYSQMTLVINLFTTIFMLGLPNSLNYFLANSESDAERRDFLSVYYTLSTFLSLVVGIVLVAATPLLVAYFDNPLLTAFWYYLALFPWTKIIGSGIENILVVYKRSGQILAFRIANNLAVLGLIIFVQLMHWDFSAYLKLYLGAEILFSCVVYALSYRLAKGLCIKLDWPLIKRIFVFSVPIGLASMVGTLNIEIDKLMIGNLLDTEQLAIYTNASKEMPVTMIATSITAVLMPQMVVLLKEDKNEQVVSLWSNAIRLSFAFMAFLAAALFVFAPEVITVLYSEKYLPGVAVFRVYSLCLLIRFTYWGMIINAKGNTKFILYSSLFALGLNVIFNYLFFRFWGMVGPAIATLLSQIALSIAQLAYSSSLLKTKMTKIFPWKGMGRILLVEGLLGALAFIAKEALPLDVLIANTFYLTAGDANVAEAVVLGCVWFGAFLLLEQKTLQSNWKKLNDSEG